MKEILPLLPKPSRYLGTEEGSIHKDPVDLVLHCVLAFPDMYEIGMSYLGQKILYTQLNGMEGVGAERVFTPCREAAALLREHGLPLATLESDTPLGDTHFIGFSITHELCFTNVLYMLDLADIPLRAKDRKGRVTDWPLLVAGGGCTLCSEPLAPFMDIMVLGEAEEVLLELLPLLIQARAEGWEKDTFLQQARFIAGVYVPEFFVPGEDGVLTPVYADYTSVKRRAVASLDNAPYPVKQVAPFGAVHNRLTLEIARGCTRGCRFCQAGMTNRPSRERKVEDIKALLEQALQSTGYEDVSFLSLSAGDFSALKTLFLDVHKACAREQVALSLPSLRVGSVDSDIMAAMAGIRHTGATLAPEAGSQRLRDVINKGVTEEELLRHVKALAGHGWQQVKLYFMVGLPTETDEDLLAIADLCVTVRDIARYQNENGKWEGPRLNVSAALSPFVPKTHTPFQWDAQISVDEMQRRIRLVRESFKQHKGLVVHWHEPAMSWLEGIFSRADRRLADLVEVAYKKGAIFCSWMEGFTLDPWYEALAECGIEAEKYTGARDYGAVLPWDHLEAGLSRRFLLAERERAGAEKITTDCRYNPCHACGACDLKNSPSLLRGEGLKEKQLYANVLNFPERDQENSPIVLPVSAGASPSPAHVGKKRPPALDAALAHKAVRYRVWHKKTDMAAFLSQLEVQSLLERALRRAQLPLAFSQGFHPLPLLSFGMALPCGVGSEAEWFALTLRSPMRGEVVQESLAPYMPAGMEVTRVELLPVSGKLPACKEELYSVRYVKQDFAPALAAWQVFWERDVCTLARQNKKGEDKPVDIRPLVRDFEIRGESIWVNMDWEKGYISPLTLVQHIYPVPVQTIKLTKLTQYFG